MIYAMRLSDHGYEKVYLNEEDWSKDIPLPERESWRNNYLFRLVKSFQKYTVKFYDIILNFMSPFVVKETYIR